MITIDEAAQKWSCSKNTVLSYVYKRYITGMCVDGEMLLLPDIKKPYIPRKRFDVSLDYYKQRDCVANDNGIFKSMYFSSGR